MAAGTSATDFTAVRTIEDLWTAIAQALPQLTPSDCASYFTAAGYGPV